MPNNDLIRVWAEIQKITEVLRWWPVFDRLGSMPDPGLRTKAQKRLRAIFEVYGAQIENELPEDLRGVTDPSLLRPDQVEELYEVATRSVERHRARALVEPAPVMAMSPDGGHRGEAQTEKKLMAEKIGTYIAGDLNIANPGSNQVTRANVHGSLHQTIGGNTKPSPINVVWQWFRKAWSAIAAIKGWWPAMKAFVGRLK
jgi:hypothetical protein